MYIIKRKKSDPRLMYIIEEPNFIHFLTQRNKNSLRFFSQGMERQNSFSYIKTACMCASIFFLRHLCSLIHTLRLHSIYKEIVQQRLLHKTKRQSFRFVFIYYLIYIYINTIHIDMNIPIYKYFLLIIKKNSFRYSHYFCPIYLFMYLFIIFFLCDNITSNSAFF